MASPGTPYYVQVGRAIRNIRADLVQAEPGYTQEHVAHESGVSLRHYQKIEAGSIDLRIATLSAIANALRTTPQRILDRADEMQRGKRR